MRKYIVWFVLAGVLLIIPSCFLCRACKAPSDDNQAQSSSNQNASNQSSASRPAINQPPKAIIQSASPSQIHKGEEVSFKGSGTDADGKVVGYGWRSSIDGNLSSEASFDTSKLSAGNHVIYFKVIDNSGASSDEATTKVVVDATMEKAIIKGAAIRWQSPDLIVFNWKVSNLAPGVEYYVYPHVGFVENSGPFGLSPESEAQELQTRYIMVVPRYFPAADGQGSKQWGTNTPPVTQPHNPKGELALLAYDPATHTAWVVAIEPINTPNW